jgi:hypothetical protein
MPWCVIPADGRDYQIKVLRNALAGDLDKSRAGSYGAGIADTNADIQTLSSKFAGITLIRNWLAVIMGKTSDAPTLAEVNVTTAANNYNNVTDSQEAIRDRGDAAWTGGGGSGGDSAATIYTYFTDGVRANAFKADVSALATTSQLNARTLLAAEYATAIDATDNFTTLEANQIMILSGVTSIRLSGIPNIQSRLPAALIGGKMDSTATVVLSPEDIQDIRDGLALEVTSQEILTEISELSPVILPVFGRVPERNTGTNLRVFYGETIEQLIYVFQADGVTPLDLTGKNLDVIVERNSGEDVDIITGSDVTIGGDDGHEIRFNYTTAITQLLGTRNWALRDADSPLTVYQYGTIQVIKVARK